MRHLIDFFAVFFLKPKVIELLRMSCGKNMFWGPTKTLMQTSMAPVCGPAVGTSG